MQAILKKLKFATQQSILPTSVVMFFEKDGVHDEELYPFRTSIAIQGSIPNGVKMIDFIKSPSMVAEAQEELNSQIGRKFEINLYDFSISELTKGRFVALDEEVIIDDFPEPDGFYDTETERVTTIRCATYKDREDALLDKLFWICLIGVEGSALGIDTNGKKYKIGYELLRGSQEKLQITVPYSHFPNVTDSFLLRVAPIKEIEFGFVLASLANGYKLNKFYAPDIVAILKNYRQYLEDVDNRNALWTNVIRFWKPKEQAVSFDVFYKTKYTGLSFNEYMKLLRDSYILAKSNIKECQKANEESSKDSFKKVAMRVEGDLFEKKMIIEEMTKSQKLQKDKYKGKEKIRLI